MLSITYIEYLLLLIYVKCSECFINTQQLLVPKRMLTPLRISLLDAANRLHVSQQRLSAAYIKCIQKYVLQHHSISRHIV